MAGLLGKFQMKSFEGWSDRITKLNHISMLQGIAPQKASNTMVQLLAAHTKPTLDTLLSQYPVKEFESDDEYYWDVIGCAKKNIALVEARDESGNSVTGLTKMVGAGTAPFYLVFGEDYFFDGEVIFGNLNQVYPFRVLGDARLEGSNAVYRVELMGGNTAGVPAERLQPGERFSVGFAPVEKELSRRHTLRHILVIVY